MRCFYFLILISLAGCFDASRPAHTIRAEQVVTLTGDAWGCESLVRLGRAAEHFNRNEYTAWAEELEPPFCFNRPGDPGEWTVYEVNGGAIRVGKSTALQYAAAAELSLPYDLMRQYWVPYTFIVQDNME